MADWQNWRQNIAVVSRAIDPDKWLANIHSLLESHRILQESLRQTQLILDLFPHTVNDHWLPIPARARAFGFWEKASHDSLLHSCFPLPRPFFHTPAHVSFIRHVCGFQALSKKAAFFPSHLSAMDECFSYLSIALSAALLFLYRSKSN